MESPVVDHCRCSTAFPQHPFLVHCFVLILAKDREVMIGSHNMENLIYLHFDKYLPTFFCGSVSSNSIEQLLHRVLKYFNTIFEINKLFHFAPNRTE